jgi:hypothetical protein
MENHSHKNDSEHYTKVVNWLEKDIYQLDQMVQTLSDYHELTSEDIQHLNRFAKRTLISMLPALLESIFIRISRLTEPSKKNGHENLTLGSLVHELNKRGEIEKATETNQRFQELRKQTHTIREDYRNKRYAHVDFGVGTGAHKLAHVPIKELQEATRKIEELMTFATESGLCWKADQQGSIKMLAQSLRCYYELRMNKASRHQNS